MGHRLETMQLHNNSSAANQKIKQSLDNRNLKSKDKYKVDNPHGKPYIGRHHELIYEVNQGAVQSSSSENQQTQWSGSKGNSDDELVKHMSNLPGYLQQAEKEKNIQEKALNFGVLDWKRLEKWKYNERMPARCHRKASSGSSTLSGASKPPTAYGVPARRKKMPPGGSSHEQKLSEPVQLSKVKSVQTQDFQNIQCSTMDGQEEKNYRKEIPSRRSYSEINSHKYRSKDSFQKIRPDKEDLFLKQVKNVIPTTSHHTKSSQDCRSGIRLDNKVDLTPQSCAAEPKNIVILVPKQDPKPSMGASQFPESRTSFDGQEAEAMRNQSSNCSSQESSSKLYAVPRPCPLPASVSPNTKFRGKKNHLCDAQGISTDLSSSPCQNERLITHSSSDANCLKENNPNVELSVPAETSKRIELDMAEQAAVKGRHPSPNRRFSFSLSRMTKSFSFKETSAVPPANSTNSIPKSGSISSGTSAGLDTSNREKANVGGRGRSSSPLRRLLDPLLRPKEVHSSETCQPPKGTSNNETLLPINRRDHLYEKKHQPSTLQALLQLTIKDGLPFFKLVVDNDGGILAAAVKKLPTSGKGEGRLVYAFYAVCDIKKKSGGWMNQGSKQRSSGFGYKVVGQMEMSSSTALNSYIYNPDEISFQTESILYCIDPGQVDKQAPNSSSKREVAAIVVKSSSQKQNDAELDRYKQKGFMQHCGDVVVILPGGIHSLPNNGAPPSLIERWKSGGLCDCGGWDVGCKLKVLAQDKNRSSRDYLNLFIQGEEHRSKPIFRLSPFENGFYSVNFDSSVPLLETFSICVSVVTSHKLSHILEIDPLGQKGFSASASFETTKASTAVRGQVPQRYVLSPPPSPVGRI